MVEKVAPELLDGALAGGATHVEHYEIATYEGLITHAEAMRSEEMSRSSRRTSSRSSTRRRGRPRGDAARAARDPAGSLIARARGLAARRDPAPAGKVPPRAVR